MAEITWELDDFDGIQRTVYWRDIKLGDTCKLFSDGVYYPDKCVHIYGTLGGATIKLKGSNERFAPSNPATLKNFANEFISVTDLTEPVLEQIAANPSNLLPVLEGGGAATDIEICISMTISSWNRA